MCIIAFTKTRQLNRNEFDNCWDSNPDGFGMAYVNKGVLLFEKGIMEKEKAWDAYQAVKKHRVVMHFRIKTAGAICPELTHPFLVTDTSPTLTKYEGKDHILFHNGCIWNWEEDCLKFILNKEKGGRVTGHMSDSRFLALLMSGADEQSMCDFLKKESGKFVLMNNKNINLIGDFEEHNGIMFSNTTYKKSYVYYNNSAWDKEYEDYYKTSKQYEIGDYVELRWNTKGFDKGEILKVKSIRQYFKQRDLLLTDGDKEAWVFSSSVRPIWFDETNTDEERGWMQL